MITDQISINIKKDVDILSEEFIKEYIIPALSVIKSQSEGNDLYELIVICRHRHNGE